MSNSIPLDNFSGIDVFGVNGNYSGIVLVLIPSCNNLGSIIQLKSLNEKQSQLKDQGWRTIVFSSDDTDILDKFKENNKLNLELLSDLKNTIGYKFKLIGSQGKLLRRTILLDNDYNVLKTFTEVLPEQHVNEVISWIKFNNNNNGRDNSSTKA